MKFNRIALALFSAVIGITFLYGALIVWINWPIRDFSLTRSGVFGESFGVINTIFSGSAVVDAENRSGFGCGTEPPLVAAFTHARKPFGQAIVYSIDRGGTWQLYDNGRHVVPNQGLDNGSWCSGSSGDACGSSHRMI